MASEDKAKLNSMLGLGEAEAAATQEPVVNEQPEETEEIVDEAAPGEESEVVSQEAQSDEEESESTPTGGAITEADLDRTWTDKDGVERTIGEAIAGFKRNEHHTQGMQAIAKTRNQYTRAMAMLGELEKAGRAILEPDLNAFAQMNMQAMAYQDPQRYKQLMPAYEAVMQRKAQYDATMNQIGQSLMADVEEAEKSAWEAVEVDLGYSITRFDEKRFDSMKDYAKKAGFNEVEIALMADSRLWRVFDKAQQFDDLKSGKAKTTQKTTTRPAGKRTTGKATKNSKSRRDAQLRQSARAGDKDANRELLRGMLNLAR